jgi:hypothetical protein
MVKVKTKLTVSQLKKSLKPLSEGELISIIVETYQLNDEVKEYLSIKFLGEETVHELFQKYKTKVENEFFPDKGFAKLRFAEAKKAISTFKKITGDNTLTFELMLYYVEMGVKFTRSYGDIDERFYNSMLSMYESLINLCIQDNELLETYRHRLANVVQQTIGIGWGFHDTLCELYGYIPNETNLT